MPAATLSDASDTKPSIWALCAGLTTPRDREAPFNGLTVRRLDDLAGQFAAEDFAALREAVAALQPGQRLRQTCRSADGARRFEAIAVADEDSICLTLQDATEQVQTVSRLEAELAANRAELHHFQAIADAVAVPMWRRDGALKLIWCNGAYAKAVEAKVEDVLKARMVAYPNTLYMCRPTGDGAAAAIVGSEEALHKYGKKPVRVACSVLTSDPYTPRDLTMPDVSTLTRNAAREAYERAAVGPEDLDLVELHDCFATAELLHYENLGLCKEGEAGRAVDEGWFEHGGKTPVNVSGGLLSKGHPLGATGVANIYEVVTHLRGEAGARQVEGAKVGMAHVIGLGSACTIHILTT